MSDQKLGSLYYDLVAKDNLTNKLKQVQSEAKKAEHALGAMGSKMKSIGSSITSVTTPMLKVGGVLAAGFLTAAGAGVKFLGEMELIDIQLKKFVGGNWKVFRDDLKSFALNDTPNLTKSILEVGSALLAAGFDRANIKPLIKDITDLNAINGSTEQGLSEIATVFGRLKSGGFGEAFERLREMKVSRTSLEQIGGLRFDKGGSFTGTADQAIEGLRKVIQAKFGDMGKQAQSTLLGVWSSIKSKIMDGLGAAVRPIFDAIKTKLTTLNWDSIIKKIGDSVQPLVKLSTDLIEKAPKLIDMIIGMTTAAGKFVDWLAEHPTIAKGMAAGVVAGPAASTAGSVAVVASNVIQMLGMSSLAKKMAGSQAGISVLRGGGTAAEATAAAAAAAGPSLLVRAGGVLARIGPQIAAIYAIGWMLKKKGFGGETKVWNGVQTPTNTDSGDTQGQSTTPTSSQGLSEAQQSKLNSLYDSTARASDFKKRFEIMDAQQRANMADIGETFAGTDKQAGAYSLAREVHTIEWEKLVNEENQYKLSKDTELISQLSGAWSSYYKNKNQLFAAERTEIQAALSLKLKEIGISVDLTDEEKNLASYSAMAASNLKLQAAAMEEEKRQLSKILSTSQEMRGSAYSALRGLAGDRTGAAMDISDSARQARDSAGLAFRNDPQALAAVNAAIGASEKRSLSESDKGFRLAKAETLAAGYSNVGSIGDSAGLWNRTQTALSAIPAQLSLGKGGKSQEDLASEGNGYLKTLVAKMDAVVKNTMIRQLVLED